MSTETTTDEFTDITDEVDELLERPDVSGALPGLRQERDQADLVYASGLAEVRKMFDITQVELARAMGVSQSAITKMEHQHDMLLSTLSSYVGGLNGRVRLVVDFDDGREIEVALRPPSVTRTDARCW